MIKTLRYLRHGQTVYNVAGIWQGRADSSLSELGISQARAAGAHFAELKQPFDHVYCSPLGRAAQTLHEALPNVGDNYATERELIEMSFGSLDGKPIVGDLTGYETYDFSQVGGESNAAVRSRTCRALDRIMSRPGHRNVLVVGHGSTGRLFFDEWRHNARRNFEGSLPNCSLVTYEFDSGTHMFSCIDIWMPQI